VVEGAEDSGSLITAKEALDYGRDVFAVPGPATSAQSRGANRLIQQGAKLVLDSADVLEEYAEFAPALKKAAILPEAQARPRLNELALSGEESALVALVRESGRLPLATLVERAGISAGQVGAQLTLLEIKGVLRQLPGSLIEAVPAP
jgi:DNA processing protein